MATGQLKIHTENILPIIKKWLYSDKDIFVRELVSNACDAAAKCKHLNEKENLSIDPSSYRIDIRIDKEAKTLTFSDNGIGMSAEEVETYIAQVAFSGAEDFVKKYQTQNEKDQIIGHFGLGFYSSYMVASDVTIDTLSYKEGAEPALWTCDGSSSYTLDTGARTERGTTITLAVDKESEEFLDENKIRSILQQYCAFLPIPIYLNDTLINKKEPLWLKNSSECTEQDYLEFYRSLYPLEQDPIFWIHLNVDYPFHLKGILYFPKVTRQFDFNRNTIKLFCNRVFVSDDCKDLIPDYLMVLKGAIDSPDIPLNVSRSTLQIDRTVRQLSSHISKKVSDRLNALYNQDKEKFQAFWPDIELIIKLGALQDEKFYERVKESLIWKTTQDTWTTASDYLERSKEKTLFYTTEDQKSSPLTTLYHDKGIEVLLSTSPVDTPLMGQLEAKLEGAHFRRIDGTLSDTLVDSSREKTVLDAEGKTESAKIANFIRSQLPEDKSLEVEAKSLSHDSTPALLVIDEDMRRMKESMALSGQKLPMEFPSKKTFVVNTNNNLIQALYRLSDKDPALAKEMTHHIYELSLLSQKQFEAQNLSEFVTRSSSLLEKMANALS